MIVLMSLIIVPIVMIGTALLLDYINPFNSININPEDYEV